MDPKKISSSSVRAIELFAPIKYHQIFTLPGTDQHGPLKVTYAIAGVPIFENAPTIFFCGGMFGGRWMAVGMDFLASKIGVRVICMDRPGFGGSTPVPLSRRLSTFLEVVPALLKHLNIKHIYLASHSAGTTYSLNLLAAHPELLDPRNPSIILFCPWVHQSYSGASMLSAAAMLPDTLLNSWNSLTGFIVNNAMPAFNASSCALSSISSLSKLWGDNPKDETKKAEREKACRENLGISLEEQEELTKYLLKCAFSENTMGGNDEARLCLKSVKDECGWDAAEDCPTLVENLRKAWEEKEGVALKVKIVFAEEDALIGVKGKEYFEDCWKQEKCGKGIEIDAMVAEGTNHETVVDSTGFFLKAYFEDVKRGRL